MSIKIGSIDNPTAIKFVNNGITTNLTEVWYKSSPSATSVKVWPDKSEPEIYYRTEYYKNDSAYNGYSNGGDGKLIEDIAYRKLYLRGTSKSGYTKYTGGELHNEYGITKNKFVIGEVITEEPIVLPQSCWGMFNNCYNLYSIDTTGWDTSNVEDFSLMFGDCVSLTSIDVSGFDTSKATNMSYMFGQAGSDVRTYKHRLTEIIGLDKFDTSNVTNMSYMFSGLYEMRTLDLRSFKTSNVTDMSNMFNTDKVLNRIYVKDGFKTTNVTSSANMFYCCEKLPNFNKAYIDKTKAYYGRDGYGYLTYKS